MEYSKLLNGFREQFDMTPFEAGSQVGVIFKDILLVCLGLFVAYKIYKKLKGGIKKNVNKM